MIMCMALQESLTELERKLDYLEQNQSARETAAYADVAPELERLRIKAVTKLREFVMTRWSHITLRNLALLPA